MEVLIHDYAAELSSAMLAPEVEEHLSGGYNLAEQHPEAAKWLEEQGVTVTLRFDNYDYDGSNGHQNGWLYPTRVYCVFDNPADGEAFAQNIRPIDDFAVG